MKHVKCLSKKKSDVTICSIRARSKSPSKEERIRVENIKKHNDEKRVILWKKSNNAKKEIEINRFFLKRGLKIMCMKTSLA